MTTVAYREQVLAADSKETVSDSLVRECQKLFRKRVREPGRFGKHYDIIIGTAGETAPGFLFMDWYPGALWFSSTHRMRSPPEQLLHLTSRFEMLILEPTGLYEADEFCRPMLVPKQDFWAVGTGSPYAMAAMEMGASAKRAVEIAAKYDVYTGGPIREDRL
jgi:ATP-dependent protease HslVU (ClpYQ) peptidase subunit